MKSMIIALLVATLSLNGYAQTDTKKYNKNEFEYETENTFNSCINNFARNVQ